MLLLTLSKITEKQQYGPNHILRRNFANNLRKIRVDPATCKIALPGWTGRRKSLVSAGGLEVSGEWSVNYTSSSVSGYQGYSTDGTNHYVTGSTQIYKFNALWNNIVTDSYPLSDTTLGGDHIGDCAYYTDKLYFCAKTAGDPVTNQQLIVRDTSDLSHIADYSLTSLGLDISGICVHGGLIYAVDFTDSSFIQKLSLTGSDLGQISTDVPTDIKFQGVTVKNGRFYISCSDNYIAEISMSGKSLALSSGGFEDDEYEGLDYSQDELRVVSYPDAVVRYLSPESHARDREKIAFAGAGGISHGVMIDTDEAFTFITKVTVDSKATNQCFIGCNDDGARSYFGLRDGKYWMGCGDTQRYSVTASEITNGKSFYASLSCSGSSGKYYIDGVQVDSISYSGTGQQTFPGFFGGLNGSTSYKMVGGIEEVFVFDTELSQTQISKIIDGTVFNPPDRAGFLFDEDVILPINVTGSCSFSGEVTRKVLYNRSVEGEI